MSTTLVAATAMALFAPPVPAAPDSAQRTPGPRHTPPAAETAKGPSGPSDVPTSSPTGVGASVDTEPDVTRYTFSGLGIDGELRTPSLLQFLARIAGAFETMGIPHRSFMPELQGTVDHDSL